MGSYRKCWNDHSSLRSLFEWMILLAFVVLVVAYAVSFIGISIWYIITDVRPPIEGAHAYQAVGIAQFKQGYNEKAIECFERSIQSQASGHKRYDRWKAYYMLGETYFKIGNDEKAVYNFKRAAIYQPRDGYIYNRIARIMVKHGQYDNAEKLIKVALALQPEEKEHLNLFGWLLKRRGAA